MGVINTGGNPLGDQIRKKMESPALYGSRKYGAHKYATGADYFGIYQVRTRYGHQVVVKQKLYVPTNPQTGIQQAWRQIFTDAIVAWQGLTDDQKIDYNTRAKFKNLSGYNLFLKEYLLSH